jgi:predicted CXXCH cytochrome family protein
LCHNANDWLNASFNHSLTSFPLTGAHQAVLCASCHTGGYAGTPRDCNACHAPSFASSQNPNHAAAGIPVLCETCHSTAAWKPSAFNHATTGFTLTGGHAVIAQCSACHKGTLLNAKPECIAIHKTLDIRYS